MYKLLLKCNCLANLTVIPFTVLDRIVREFQLFFTLEIKWAENYYFFVTGMGEGFKASLTRLRRYFQGMLFVVRS